MSQSAANMQKAVEAMEKAQTTETQQIVVLPSYSVRFIIFMSVAAMLVVTLFPVLVIRLAVVSSELNPFHSNQEHSPANLAVNVTDAPAWTHQETHVTASNQKLESAQPTQSDTESNSSVGLTASTSASAASTSASAPAGAKNAQKFLVAGTPEPNLELALIPSLTASEVASKSLKV